MSKQYDNLEERHFGVGRADSKYPCARDDYLWNNRPDVADSRVITKENVVIHGLQDDAVKFVTQGEQSNTAFHYQMAADYYNMAGDRRASLIEIHPQLNDQGHADAVDYCYNKAS